MCPHRARRKDAPPGLRAYSPPPDEGPEKEFRAGVDKLYQMAGELKEELDKTATTNVLSVRMYKKMQEIEKLSKQLKDKAKG